MALPLNVERRAYVRSRFNGANSYEAEAPGSIHETSEGQVGNFRIRTKENKNQHWISNNVSVPEGAKIITAKLRSDDGYSELVLRLYGKISRDKDFKYCINPVAKLTIELPKPGSPVIEPYDARGNIAGLDCLVLTDGRLFVAGADSIQMGRKAASLDLPLK